MDFEPERFWAGNRYYSMVPAQNRIWVERFMENFAWLGKPGRMD